MSEYIPTIGLEIHAELKTKTKMFCRCLNDADEAKPNTNICPICMAHPGALPFINKEAVRQVMRVGLALGGKLADFSEFDRKNYFYPDIPKGFQISQYKYPIVSGGMLNGVAITRVHLEEDTAKSFHFSGRGDSFIDFNRAGVPLMELVTEPVINNSTQAGDFARELQLLLRYLGASDANMEMGQMRVEANVSVSKDPNKLGTKTEVKNINSFKAAEKAIEYEIKRQTEVLEEGGIIVQETRGFDENTGGTFSQRKKESSHDYRYFPEPDLPKMKLSEVEEFKNLRETLPELPWEKRVRFTEKYGVKKAAVDIFVADAVLADFFEAVVSGNEKNADLVASAANYITSDLTSLMKAAGEVADGAEKIKISPAQFAELIKMVLAGEVSSRGAKDVLAVLFERGGETRKIAEDHGLLQKSDTGEIKKIVEAIIAEQAGVVLDYKAGKAAALQFLVGQGMKRSKGSANPKILADIFKELLG